MVLADAPSFPGAFFMQNRTLDFPWLAKSSLFLKWQLIRVWIEPFALII